MHAKSLPLYFIKYCFLIYFLLLQNPSSHSVLEVREREREAGKSLVEKYFLKTALSLLWEALFALGCFIVTAHKSVLPWSPSSASLT